ncbi:MAG: ArsR family transcriptional regulator [Haloarculaceae archaeon]
MTTEGRFDRVVDALAHRYRHRVLVALLEHALRGGGDPVEPDALDAASGAEPVDGQVLETVLVHNHLPKLDSMGYVTWDRETDAIARGPNWAEIAPLLRLLRDHADELPDDWL